MSNLTDALKPEFPDDIDKLQQSIPLLRRFSPIEVQVLYQAFSDSYCAQWLGLNTQTLAQFLAWLEE